MTVCCWQTVQPETADLSSWPAEESPACDDDGNEDGDEIPNDFPETDSLTLYTFGISFILSLPLMLSAGFTLSYVFTAGTVSYRCLISECEDSANTSLYPSWLSNAVPYTNGEPEACTRFTVQNATESCSTTSFTDESETCDAWVYDNEELTIQNEWDLTCTNNLWKLSLPGTINNVGQFVGLIFAGYISDRYGRRNTLAASTIMSSIFGIIRACSINYEMFVVFEFLDATSGAAIYSAGFLLGMEFVGPKTRVLLSNVICTMYALGEIVLAFCAMWLRSWRLLIFTFYLPGLLAVFIPCLVPESVRWLLSKGRGKEAEAVLRKLAARNRIAVSEKSIARIRNADKKIQERKRSEKFEFSPVSPVKQVIGNRTILIRVLICTFCWIANVFVYYGLSLQSVTVAGDKYVNFALVALVEIPGQLITWILVDYVGRKPTLSGSFFLSGVFCIITIFVPTDWWYLPLIVFLIGKFCITIAFSTIYVLTAEMFPTTFRHSVLGFCSMVARVGSMIAPQMPLLAQYMTSLPLLMFGTVAVVASMLSLNFPETVGTKLPDTVHEAVNIGKLKRKVDTVPTIS